MNLISQALVSDGPDVMGRLSNRWVLGMTLKFPFIKAGLHCDISISINISIKKFTHVT